ncbi:hypothetical protein [Streptodolium elevatio]|uniref:Uncharacterized protein n=1 Tax=Streptodolium elevatio TaxID=3157996 RepID=A0ABV3DS94_9ACTN
MGKRQRRRDRRRSGDGAAAGYRVVLPSSEVPWVEVRIAAGATAAERDLCLAYWKFTEPMGVGSPRGRRPMAEPRYRDAEHKNDMLAYHRRRLS